MRICLVYDCLFPWTVGGAERWYRALGERLAAEGHEVTYLTLRQWPRDAPPRIPGVRVVPVGPRVALYAPGGRRRMGPPLLFGLGVLAHLLRHGRSYDVVHTASFPYFSLLAAAAARPAARYRLQTDWFEVWTRAYWDGYLGRLGVVGWWVQALCARVPQRAFSFSRMHAARLRSLGLRRDPEILRGLYDGTGAEEPEPPAAPPVALFAGRHIPEKRVGALVGAAPVARAAVPGLVLDVFGDGPETPQVAAAVASAGLGDVVRLHGFVDAARVDAAMRTAACLVLPSQREGFGLVVVEASARGCPSVVVAGPDNAATELVEDGVNGVIAPSASPEDLGAAIARAVRGGDELRRSTLAWYRAHEDELALTSSLGAVAASYASARS